MLHPSCAPLEASVSVLVAASPAVSPAGAPRKRPSEPPSRCPSVSHVRACRSHLSSLPVLVFWFACVCLRSPWRLCSLALRDCALPSRRSWFETWCAVYAWIAVCMTVVCVLRCVVRCACAAYVVPSYSAHQPRPGRVRFVCASGSDLDGDARRDVTQRESVARRGSGCT